MISHSLLFDRDLDLRNDYADRNNIVYAGNLQPDNHVIRMANGRLYSVHSFGLPVLTLPIFASAYLLSSQLDTTTLAKLHMTKWTLLRLLIAISMILLTAFLSRVMYEHLQLEISKYWAFVAVLVCFLSIPILPTGLLFFTEIPAAFLAFFAYHLMNQDSGRLSPIKIGLLISCLPSLHLKYTLFSIFLLVIFILRCKHLGISNRTVYISIAIYFLIQMFVAIVHWNTWGSVLPPYAYRTSPFSWEGLFRGTLGLFFDRGFGLLPYSPIYLLVPIGSWLMMRQNKQAVLKSFALFGTILFVSAPFIIWWGGWSPPARYLTPGLIFLIPFVAIACRSLWQSRLFVIPVILIAIQLLFAMIFWSNPKLMWNQESGESQLYSNSLPVLHSFLPSLMRYSMRDLWLCFLWMTTISAGLFAVVKSLSRSERVQAPGTRTGG